MISLVAELFHFVFLSFLIFDSLKSIILKSYPLKFTPIPKYRLWGGNKLNTLLNKGFEGENNGESWEISDVQGDETKVSNGEF